MESNHRQAALERLAVFVGEWSVEVSLAPGGPAARSVFEWALDEQFLVQRTEIAVPEAPDSIAIVGLVAEGDAYVQHYFDSRGVARVYAMTFDGRDWELLRTSPDFTPLAFSQRFRGAFGDGGDTIRGTWETSQDGSSWERDFDLTYRRSGA
jgi:hypothetical protein